MPPTPRGTPPAPGKAAAASLLLALLHLCSFAPSGGLPLAGRPAAQSSAARNHSKVIIIGAGAAGHAAAARLMENGFYDVTILEAEGRVGGRIRTVNFAEGVVDLGAEWVHGEAGNVLFEMAEPLGLLGHHQARADTNMAFVWAGGAVAHPEQTTLLYRLASDVVDEVDDGPDGATGSKGELFLDRFGQRLLELDQRPPPELVNRFLGWFEQAVAFGDGDSWFNVSTKGNYESFGGEQALPWKRSGMKMALDLITKRYPNPAQELPVWRRVLLNSEVRAIRWGEHAYGAAGPPPEEPEPELTQPVTTTTTTTTTTTSTTTPTPTPTTTTTTTTERSAVAATTESGEVGGPVDAATLGSVDGITTELIDSTPKEGATTEHNDVELESAVTEGDLSGSGDAATEEAAVGTEPTATEPGVAMTDADADALVAVTEATAEPSLLGSEDVTAEPGVEAAEGGDATTEPVMGVEGEGATATAGPGVEGDDDVTTEPGVEGASDVTTEPGVVQADAEAPQADEPHADAPQEPKAPIVVELSNGGRHTADMVLVTVSLGVLKHSADTLFDPPLPRRKTRAIRALGFGQVDKLFMYYSYPWWPSSLSGYSLLVTKEDLDAFKLKYPQYGAQGHWVHGLSGFYIDQHKPNVVLMDWMVGEPARVMERYSDYQIMLGCKRWLDMFLGRNYSIPLPVGFTRSKWWSNPHFRGSYSYRSLDSDRADAWPRHLEEPLYDDQGSPALMFAGEATNERHYATVHGAIESGWREGDRILRALRAEGRLGPPRRQGR